MKFLYLLTLTLIAWSPFSAGEPCPDLLDMRMPLLRSQQPFDFCEALSGKVILAVNTASNCGYTPQFKGLEALYQRYKDQGLVVVGFPSNDFNQEFNEAEKTAKVCYRNYGVTFPMLEKSAVKAADANPFFRKLIKISGAAPKWNFHKYLIDRKAVKVIAFSSQITPEQLQTAIEALLHAGDK